MRLIGLSFLLMEKAYAFGSIATMCRAADIRASQIGQQETLGPRPYYYAYADRRFCEVTDESNGYRKFARLTILNNTDRCVRLLTVMRRRPPALRAKW